ncbi:uncharacterized protein LOC101851953 isoform X2 [Aplysia californica]|uniref:Uncharacterized protein LOC101851953 isoform X2 n=1 Tax=Aplysia californica TaxID=6500 RepID=A0ABM0JR48_APLCA|nr:uncharacterized protein LOC101851953 isoform X2 [Aplysia californica]
MARVLFIVCVPASEEEKIEKPGIFAKDVGGGDEDKAVLKAVENDMKPVGNNADESKTKKEKGDSNKETTAVAVDKESDGVTLTKKHEDAPEENKDADSANESSSGVDEQGFHFGNAPKKNAGIESKEESNPVSTEHTSEEGLKGTEKGDTSDSADVDEDTTTGDGEKQPVYERFISEHWTLLEKVKTALEVLRVTSVQWHLAEDNTYVAMFITGDGERCEEVLDKLAKLDVGVIPRSSVSVFPASISAAEEEEVDTIQKMIEREDKLAEKVTEFKKSIKSRLVVAQVVDSVKGDALFTFDYLMLLVLASLVSVMGLLESSSVVLVASMLISPLMGPILAGVFGTVISNEQLRNLGCKSEIKGLVLCILVGFLTGFIPAVLELGGLSWRSSDSWPTFEMSSRGSLRSLPVGVLIAIPSGAGVALSILGGKVGSLVGVAISASLLPPAVNAGLLWANAIVVSISPPLTVHRGQMRLVPTNSTANATSATLVPVGGSGCRELVNNDYINQYSCDMGVENLILGVVSLLLTVLNILCIIIMGILVLKIKEVTAPSTQTSQGPEKDFFGKDLKVARQSYQTAKGQTSVIMGKKILEEYQKIKLQVGCEHEESEDKAELFKIMEDMEESPVVQALREQLPGKWNRWSSFFHDPEDDNDHHDRPYHTINLGRSGASPTHNDVELQEKPRGSRSAEPRVNNVEETNYFTIHRYIPASDLLRSRTSQESGRFTQKLIIPKASRFQVAKVKVRDSMSKLDAIEETVPLLETKSGTSVQA